MGAFNGTEISKGPNGTFWKVDGLFGVLLHFESMHVPQGYWMSIQSNPHRAQTLLSLVWIANVFIVQHNIFEYNTNWNNICPTKTILQILSNEIIQLKVNFILLQIQKSYYNKKNLIIIIQLSSLCESNKPIKIDCTDKITNVWLLC